MKEERKLDISSFLGGSRQKAGLDREISYPCFEDMEGGKCIGKQEKD